MTARPFVIALAAAYTLAGIGALIIGFVIAWDDPLAPVYALLLGAPWTFLLSAAGGYAEDSLSINITLIVGAIALNAALLWWWALTRRLASATTPDGDRAATPPAAGRKQTDHP
jgi:hypothetical protein